MTEEGTTPSWRLEAQSVIPSPVRKSSRVENAFSKRENPHYRALGTSHGIFYYYPYATSQVLEISGHAHGKQNLMTLAPLAYWTATFPMDKRHAPDWDIAADHVKRLCEKEGVFDYTIVRGRGAWWDNGKLVFHLGDSVILDGVQHPISQVPDSKYIYESQRSIDINITAPLTAKEGSEFLDICRKIPWADPLSAIYLAGWCAVAHIGGALDWRPHIWVVGAAGSGKSTVMNSIVTPAMGKNIITAISDTSASGIYQKLKHDSMPVVMDEIEADDQKQQERVQRVLSLVRQSSSNTGSEMLKGTPGGKSISYIIRSCFAFSSIHASIIHAADKSRVTLLEIDQHHRTENFPEVQREINRLITPDFSERFTARSIQLAGVIRKNARTFSGAMAAQLGKQRAGDQLGYLIAGAFSLTSSKEITFDEAEAWVRRHNWSVIMGEIATIPDETRLWRFLMSHKIKYALPSGFSAEERVGHLIDLTTKDDAFIGAKRALMEAGFLVRLSSSGKWEIVVSNSAEEIRKLLQHTKWPSDWGNVLRRIRGAETTNSVYFGYQGSRARGVAIPYSPEESRLEVE